MRVHVNARQASMRMALCVVQTAAKVAKLQAPTVKHPPRGLPGEDPVPGPRRRTTGGVTLPRQRGQGRRRTSSQERWPAHGVRCTVSLFNRSSFCT